MNLLAKQVQWTDHVQASKLAEGKSSGVSDWIPKRPQGQESQAKGVP